jgi:hypothetical protein
MPTSIELVPFDPYSASSVELGVGDEIIGVDTKIYNQARFPYLIVKRAMPVNLQDDLTIWTVNTHNLSETDAPKSIQITDKGRLFVIQRISDSGARTGNYASYLAWLVVVDCSGKRKSVNFTQVENGNAPFDAELYIGTFGKMDKLFNLFADSKN